MKLMEKKEFYQYLLGKPHEPRADSSLQGVNQEKKVWSALWSLELSSPRWESPIHPQCTSAAMDTSSHSSGGDQRKDNLD